LGIAAGAVAFGFLVGLAVPSTRVEDERLGTVADQVKDQVKQTGHEAVERGRDVVQQAAGSAVETAKQQGQQHGQAITERAKDSMGDIQP
jgi:Tfp pilus assembly protein FimT